MARGAPAEALNAAVEAPGGNVTDAGTVTKALFDERATIVPLKGAGAESITAQAEVAPEPTAAGEHVSFNMVVEVTVSCAEADVPFMDAVSVVD